MSIVARARIFVARRPWIHWMVVAALIGLVVAVEIDRADGLDAARDRWGATTSALVATADLAPGDELVAEWLDLPEAIVPASAVRTTPSVATVRQHVAAGEIVVDADVVDAPGPVGHVTDGEAIVPINDPLFTVVEVGARVAVFADGITVADEATITLADGDVVYVAVARPDAPSVAAAAHGRIASIVYLD